MRHHQSPLRTEERRLGQVESTHEFVCIVVLYVNVLKYVQIRKLIYVNMCTYVFSIYLCELNSHECISLLSRAIIFYMHVCM